ncbi:hypothetical protein [Cellulomonas dongxiuzhuiae]|uniref:hypothetical protein n=1 Tax=Cellulomonas dongxiuzhuiae TaxID=2819979 RepID=UPI001AAFD3C9|nr:hypothetical protein [Cellulomonas dongxiuzhuiae]MBO3089792.1 hypothetical protein [Cellulomonas dongxiuzhuiae]
MDVLNEPAVVLVGRVVDDRDGSAATVRERLTAGLEVDLPTLRANLTGSLA